jgi:pyruvate carboxylase subunit B
MIRAAQAKKIAVQLTTFRDGLQSSFGGKVSLKDFLPSMEFAAKEVGVRHFEFGGGARYQAPYFYLREDPFECMATIKETCGKDLDYQILTRSVSGVTLTTQNLAGLELQARLMKEHGTTIDRNFDYMNDVDNLVKTGKPIVAAGMHHQVAIALMGLPFHSEKVHTKDFYIEVGRKLLLRHEKGEIRIDSLCLKDASGTTDPSTIYETALGLKKLMPPEMRLVQHTHDTASLAVAQYMAGIAGGVDGIDLACRPMASGTVQPDVRSVAHALKGTGYSLDINVQRVGEIERMLTADMKEYAFNPTTVAADARVVGFPMPGGAIGPNIHMMEKAGIAEKYADVLAEFPIVVEAGGAFCSVTPGSQQYWLQAFNNVMYGRWKQIEAGYGRAVLGYFGRTPLAPTREVIDAAREQLGLPVFEGDPLEAAPDNLPAAREALTSEGLGVNDKNIFLVLSSMTPTKKMEANEGLRFLLGKGKLDVPLKKTEDTASETPKKTSPPPLVEPFETSVTVSEGGKTRVFQVRIEPDGGPGKSKGGAPVEDRHTSTGQDVFSTFGGSVEIADILVNVGDSVAVGQPVAKIEAMKATHDIRSPFAGIVSSIHVQIGDEVDSATPILTL